MLVSFRGNNSTYMLFLDPRPDLDDSDVENSSAPVSATHENQLDIATPRVGTKSEASFPPMIISLVIPEHIANGSNPLLLPEGLDATNSLMEITCQVTYFRQMLDASLLMFWYRLLISASQLRNALAIKTT